MCRWFPKYGYVTGKWVTRMPKKFVIVNLLVVAKYRRMLPFKVLITTLQQKCTTKSDLELCLELHWKCTTNSSQPIKVHIKANVAPSFNK